MLFKKLIVIVFLLCLRDNNILSFFISCWKLFCCWTEVASWPMNKLEILSCFYIYIIHQKCLLLKVIKSYIGDQINSQLDWCNVLVTTKDREITKTTIYYDYKNMGFYTKSIFNLFFASNLIRLNYTYPLISTFYISIFIYYTSPRIKPRAWRSLSSNPTHSII